MSTISELLIKIGADSSGLKQELSKSQEAIKSTFNTNPINEFTGALTGATNGVGNIISKLSGIAAVAAGGFGLVSMIDSAVNAGEAMYQLTNRLQISTSEASKLSRILRLTGGDTDSFAGVMLRLDKNIASSGESGEKTRHTLAAFGVSLSDANGKLLPMNEQLKNLADGYKKAAEYGFQQEYIMNTLGVRGLSLEKTLRNYSEAAENASRIKSIGLNADEMHKMEQELKVLKMQASQIELAGGAALAPIAKEVIPDIIVGLSKTASYLGENKQHIRDITKSALELLVIYKSMQAVNKIGSSVNNAWANAKAMTAIKSTPVADISALSISQEKSINRAVAASNAGYAKMEKAAIKSAQTANMSAEESAIFISEKCIEIANQAALAAEKIRLEMTAGFRQSNMAAQQSLEETALGFKNIEVAATQTATKVVALNNEMAISAQETAVAQARLSESIVAVGSEATIAGAKATASNLEIAETARVATMSEIALAEATAGTGVTATIAGSEAVVAHNSATLAAIENAGANTALAVATARVGNEAVVSSTKTVSSMATATTAVNTLKGAVFALMGGWLGVAAGAAYATYKMLEHFDQKGRVESYDPDAEVRINSEGKLQKKKYIDHTKDAEGAPQYGYTKVVATGGYEWTDLTEGEVEDYYAYRAYIEKLKKNKPWLNDGDITKDAEYKKLLGQFQANGDDKVPKIKKEKEEKDTTVHYSNIDKLGDYANQAQYAAETYKLDPNLFAAMVLAESNGNPNAVSSAGAIGLSQLMPETAKSLGVNAYDPNENLMGGAAYLSKLLGEFGGDIRLALAAYNAGPGAVQKSGGIPHNGETENYVSKVMGIYNSATTSTGAPKYDPAGDLKKLQQAKEEAANLLTGIEMEIGSKTETAYQIGMDKIVSDVAKKSEQIAKLNAEGIDTTKLSQKLGEYKAMLETNVVENWRNAWMKVKNDNDKILAEITDNYKLAAEAEYDETVRRLDEERKEKLKTIQQDKNDAVAKLEIDKWYNNSVILAAKKRDQEIIDAHEKAMNSYRRKGDISGALSEMNSKDGINSQELAGKQKLIDKYYDLWKKKNASSFEDMAQAADIFGNGIESIFEDIGTGVTKAGDMIKNIGDLILKTIVKIQAQKLAANVTDSLLSAFGGGGNNSNSMSTSSWMKYTGLNSGVGSSNNYDFSYHPFAEGGIVSAPTLGLIGERSYKEAIVPLTDGNLKMLGGGNKGGGVQVNIINKTSSKVEVQESRYDDSAQQWVLGVVVDAAERNVNGFGTSMKTALGAR